MPGPWCHFLSFPLKSLSNDHNGPKRPPSSRLFCGGGHRSSERGRDLPEVTQPVSQPLPCATRQ